MDIGAHELDPLDSGKQSASTYEEWRNLHFSEAQRDDPAVSGEAADPAGDGVGNLIKYALNLNPWKPSAHLLPPSTLNSHGLLTLTYTKPAGRDDIEYNVEVSQDLVHWKSGDDLVQKVVQVNSDGTETITATTPANASVGFIRLSVKLRQKIAFLSV